MKDIKFRGKRVDNGEWVYGYFTKSKGYKNIDEYNIWQEETPYYVIPETVGQYTGLCDKEGNKIFEGDILKFYKSTGVEEYYAQVVFEDGRFMAIAENPDKNTNLKVMVFDIIHSAYVRKIIGNIYDNPELLEVMENENNDTN